MTSINDSACKHIHYDIILYISGHMLQDVQKLVFSIFIYTQDLTTDLSSLVIEKFAVSHRFIRHVGLIFLSNKVRMPNLEKPLTILYISCLVINR